VQAINEKPDVVTDVDVILKDGSLSGIRSGRRSSRGRGGRQADAAGRVRSGSHSEVRQRNLEIASARRRS